MKEGYIMCGITGWVSWTRLLENQEKTLKEMTESITHRGPDADGFWLDGQAAFGHRRLIVVDPEGGLQPMIYEADGNKVALSYNGKSIISKSFAKS